MKIDKAKLLAVIQSGAALLVLFGLDLTTDQMAGIMIFSGAVLALFAWERKPQK